MSRDEHYSPFAPSPGPRIPTRGELLYEFVATLAMGPTRVRCELVDHGPNGFEARIFYDDQHHMSHSRRGTASRSSLRGRGCPVRC